MSLVVPRPPLPSEVNEYDPAHRRRLSVKPGITCLWQIRGRNDIDFSEWTQLDLQYIDTWADYAENDSGGFEAAGCELGRCRRGVIVECRVTRLPKAWVAFLVFGQTQGEDSGAH